LRDMPHLAPYKDDDYPALLELTRASMAPGPETPPGGGAVPEPAMLGALKDLVTQAGSTTLVMWDGELMAGYVTFYPDDDHMFINWLVVHPAYRNQGFATMLLEEVGRVAAESALRALRICLYEGNRTAIALCEAAGFRRIACEPAGWVMEKNVVPDRGD